MSSLYTKRGGAYGERREGKGDDKNSQKGPSDALNKSYLTTLFPKKKNIFSTLANKAFKLNKEIWLYRTKARVRMTHRSKKSILIYLCTVTLSSFSKVKPNVKMTKNTGRRGNLSVTIGS